MGTRGLTIVMSNNQMKVAQYGQWDHYPSGQGKTILGLLKNFDLAKFKTKIDKLEFFTPEDLNEIDIECASLEDESRWKQLYPQLSRDWGTRIIEGIYYDKWDDLELSIDKVQSSFDDLIFVPYTYLVDLDKNTLEVYDNYGKTPLTPSDRFYFVLDPKYVRYPNLMGLFKLDNLPTFNEFLDVLEPEDAPHNEEEEDEPVNTMDLVQKILIIQGDFRIKLMQNGIESEKALEISSDFVQTFIDSGLLNENVKKQTDQFLKNVAETQK